ncbi:unnamed protein product, partial [Linum tenue]
FLNDFSHLALTRSVSNSPLLFDPSATKTTQRNTKPDLLSPSNRSFSLSLSSSLRRHYTPCISIFSSFYERRGKGRAERRLRRRREGVDRRDDDAGGEEVQSFGIGWGKMIYGSGLYRRWRRGETRGKGETPARVWLRRRVDKFCKVTVSQAFVLLLCLR